MLVCRQRRPPRPPTFLIRPPSPVCTPRSPLASSCTVAVRGRRGRRRGRGRLDESAASVAVWAAAATGPSPPRPRSGRPGVPPGSLVAVVADRTGLTLARPAAAAAVVAHWRRTNSRRRAAPGRRRAAVGAWSPPRQGESRSSAARPAPLTHTAVTTPVQPRHTPIGGGCTVTLVTDAARDQTLARAPVNSRAR